jgi:cytochrome c oxidase subunit 3
MTAIDAQATPNPDDGAHGHDDHEHVEGLAHHWDNLEQQFEANKLGMWLFLATEFLLFGGLFCAYAVFRHNRPELFEWGSQFLDPIMGAVNTFILIASSLTMALGVWAAQKGLKKLLVWMMVLTFMGGVGFLVVKYFEYTSKFEKNIFMGTAYYTPSPAKDKDGAAAADHGGDHGDMAGMEIVGDAPAVGTFTLDSDDPELPKTDMVMGQQGPTGLAREPKDDPRIYNPYKPHGGSHEYPDHLMSDQRPADAHIFFSIYYCMTGLHVIHVIIGMGVIAWLGMRAVRGDFGPTNFTAVDLGGLYWHVVDMIWIFLFPLLYLIH